MQAAGCRFEPCHLHHKSTPRQLSGQSAGLSSRKPRVRLPHEAPDQFAEIAQQVERRVEGACVGGSKPSLGTRSQNLVSSAGIQSAGLRSRRSHVRVVHEVPTTGAWQRGRLRLPVKQSPTRTRWFESIRTHHSHTGLAQLAERRPPKPKVRGSIPWSGASASRRSQVVEGGGLQSRRRKPASVRIGSSSPGLVSSADESGRLLPGGSAVRIGHEAPVHFPDSADGRAPGC